MGRSTSEKSDRCSQVILASRKLAGTMGVVILIADAVVQSGAVAVALALALKHLKYFSGPVKLFSRGSTILSLHSPLAGRDAGPIIFRFVTPFSMLMCCKVGCLLRKEHMMGLSMNCVSKVKEWRYGNVGGTWEVENGWCDNPSRGMVPGLMEVRSRVG